MAADTHTNVLVEDFEKAYKLAQGAVDDLKNKADVLIARVRQEEPTAAATVSQTEGEAKQLAAEVESDVSKAK